jgi:hypothetical protein
MKCDDEKWRHDVHKKQQKTITEDEYKPIKQANNLRKEQMAESEKTHRSQHRS